MLALSWLAAGTAAIIMPAKLQPSPAGVRLLVQVRCYGRLVVRRSEILGVVSLAAR